MLTGYIGTYNSPEGKGIYQFNFDEETGSVSEIKSYYAADDAKCAILNQDKLAITQHKNGQSGIALLDAQSSTLLDEALFEDKTPCFIKYVDDFIYTANYHDGVVMVYQVNDDKLKLVKRIDVVTKAGCHQVVIYKHYLVVPCLLIDEIRVFDINDDFNLVKTIAFPKGTGPRHGIFSKDNKNFFLVSELSSEFFVFAVNELNFDLVYKVPLLSPEKVAGSSSAAIRITDDEQYIYVSTRGADLLTVIKLDANKQPEIIQQVHDDISHPRDFLLTSDEEYLLVVNRDSNDLVSFKLDKNSGKINNVINKIAVPKGVGITLAGVNL